MSATLSIVIASHSESDLPNTLDSIRATAGDAVECVVIDDASCKPIVTDKARVIRTQRRIGVGPARTLGAIHATGDYLLFTDAHMRFLPGWYEAAMSRIVGREKTFHVGCCLGLGLVEKDKRFKGRHLVLNMDANNPSARYQGATWNFSGPDQNVRGKFQVMECVWNRSEQADDSEQSAAMGAIYVWPRKWFLELNPLAHLRSWSGDEQSMSLKAWLAGGEIRLIKTVQVGHRFRHETERTPFRLSNTDTIYNKLFLAHTCLPPDKAMILQNKFPKGGELQRALQMLHNDQHLVEVERAKNQQLFTVSFDEFLAKFNLPFPVK